MTRLYGYSGKLLRIDLTNEKVTEENLDEATLRKWVGGTGLGAKPFAKYWLQNWTASVSTSMMG